ncbi:MAG: phosphatidylglycerophosphatase A family protein [Planctomycetia bacterium]
MHRLFDVAKPYPICRLEKLPGGWGVMADDCLAAVFALVVMHALYTVHFLPWTT